MPAKAKRNQRKAPDALTSESAALGEIDWNFDAVPDEELVGCCYWEYARESAFIRGIRQRCWEVARPFYVGGQYWNRPVETQLHEDLQKVQRIGYPAEVFLRGISFPPDGVLPEAHPLKPDKRQGATGSFPTPWVTLTGEERAYRSRIGTDVERIPLVPFQRGLSFEARDIADWVKARQKEADAANQKVREQNPDRTEEYLCGTGWLKFPEIRPSLCCLGGCEITVAQIHWESFTNDQIVNCFRKWVKANRPNKFSAPDRRGRKARDWRVALERLGMTRLLHQYTLGQMPVKSPKAWKLYVKREWYKERKRAGEMFHQLFPFLPATDQPISWRTQGGRSSHQVGTKRPGI